MSNQLEKLHDGIKMATIIPCDKLNNHMDQTEINCRENKFRHLPKNPTGCLAMIIKTN